MYKYKNSILGFPTSSRNYPSLQCIDKLDRILINNVGNPFIKSDTWRYESKSEEMEIINTLSKYFGNKNDSIGYVTNGGTEGNEASLRWLSNYFIFINKNKISVLEKRIYDLQSIINNNKKYNNDDISTYKELLQKKHMLDSIKTHTVMYTDYYTHYSINKISKAMKLKTIPIMYNKDGSMNIISLEDNIKLNISKYPHNNIIVIVNIGTTLTGAIDDIVGIQKVINRYPDVNIKVHADGAIYGILLPIMKKFNITNYFDYIDTLSLSFHKYLGLYQPCGLVLTKKYIINSCNHCNIEYAGNIQDITVSGSRSGFNVFMIHKIIFSELKLNISNCYIEKIYLDDVNKAKYINNKLSKFTNTQYIDNQLIIRINKPDKKIIKKYQLMVDGNYANIFCFNRNIKTIKSFLYDLKQINYNTKMIKYKILTETYIEKASKVFTLSFIKNEPLSKYMNISYDNFYLLAKYIIKSAARDKKSIIAVDSLDNVIGCVICEDYNDMIDLSQFKDFEVLFSIFKSLSNNININLPNNIAHIWITAIDEKYMGNNLSFILNYKACQLLYKLGYKYIYAEFTNKYNERTINKFQHIRLAKIKLSTYKYNNKYVYKNLNGYATSYIGTIDSNINLIKEMQKLNYYAKL